MNFISSSVAFMIERNKEAFPGFRGKDIKEKLHTYDGQQYYSVPPQFVHYIGKLLLSARPIFLFCSHGYIMQLQWDQCRKVLLTHRLDSTWNPM